MVLRGLNAKLAGLRIKVDSPSVRDPVPTPQTPEQLLRERYKLHRQLSPSLYGDVYHATDTQTGHSVVVKSSSTHLESRGRALDGSHADDSSAVEEEALRRLTENARTRHHVTGLCDAFDGAPAADGTNTRRYIVMEYAAGGDLEQWLERRGDVFAPRFLRLYHATGRHPFENDMQRVGVALLHAVIACHNAGVAHRDLSAENVVFLHVTRHSYECAESRVSSTISSARTSPSYGPLSSAASVFSTGTEDDASSVCSVASASSMSIPRLDMSAVIDLYTGDDIDLRLCDFGVALVVDREDNDERKWFSRRLVGKTQYRAPECHLYHNTRLADAWSCGVLLFMLLVGVPPFELPLPVDARFNAIMEDEMDALLRLWHVRAFFSHDAVDLLRRLLAPAERRITVEEALRHRFFSKIPTPDKRRPSVLNVTPPTRPRRRSSLMVPLPRSQRVADMSATPTIAEHTPMQLPSLHGTSHAGTHSACGTARTLSFHQIDEAEEKSSTILVTAGDTRAVDHKNNNNSSRNNNNSSRNNNNRNNNNRNNNSSDSDHSDDDGDDSEKRGRVAAVTFAAAVAVADKNNNNTKNNNTNNNSNNGANKHNNGTENNDGAKNNNANNNVKNNNGKNNNGSAAADAEPGRVRRLLRNLIRKRQQRRRKRRVALPLEEELPPPQEEHHTAVDLVGPPRVAETDTRSVPPLPTSAQKPLRTGEIQSESQLTASIRKSSSSTELAHLVPPVTTEITPPKMSPSVRFRHEPPQALQGGSHGVPHSEERQRRRSSLAVRSPISLGSPNVQGRRRLINGRRRSSVKRWRQAHTPQHYAQHQHQYQQTQQHSPRNIRSDLQDVARRRSALMSRRSVTAGAAMLMPVRGRKRGGHGRRKRRRRDTGTDEGAETPGPCDVDTDADDVDKRPDSPSHGESDKSSDDDNGDAEAPAYSA